MARIFEVSERVAVDISGFEPWPATIENVVSEAGGSNVNYHVRLDGSVKSIPVNKEKIRQLGKVEEEKWRGVSLDELWHGARKRLEVVEGVYIGMFGDHSPFSLLNCVSVEDIYENVPDIDRATLKLSRVAHNAKVRYTELETKFTFHAMQNKMIVKLNNETDGYAHVMERTGRKCSKTVIRFPCPMCGRKFKTRMALKKHLECNTDCADSKRASKSYEHPQQCPKCFSLYKNEEMLFKHMLVHDKNLPKKKNGIRDFIRQIMSHSKACRVPSYNPASNPKPKSIQMKTGAMDRKRKMVESPEDSELDENDSGDNSTSDTDSLKTNSSRVCGYCGSNRCNCKSKIRNHELHSEREKERRKQMRHAFTELAEVLGRNGGTSSKNTILHLALDEVSKLEASSKRLQQALADLRDMNVRLVTRQYQLSA